MHTKGKPLTRSLKRRLDLGEAADLAACDDNVAPQRCSLRSKAVKPSHADAAAQTRVTRASTASKPRLRALGDRTNACGAAREEEPRSAPLRRSTRLKRTRGSDADVASRECTVLPGTADKTQGVVGCSATQHRATAETHEDSAARRPPAATAGGAPGAVDGAPGAFLPEARRGPPGLSLASLPQPRMMTERMTHEHILLSSMTFLDSVTAPFLPTGARRAYEAKRVAPPYVDADTCTNFTAATRQAMVDWALSRKPLLNVSSESIHLGVRLTDLFLATRGPEAFLGKHVTPAAVREVRGDYVAGWGPASVLPARSAPQTAAEGAAYRTSFPCKLRRLTATALMVAAKLVERQLARPRAHVFAEMSDADGFGGREIVAAEQALLRVIEWQPSIPTATGFATAFLEFRWAQTGQHAPKHLLRREQAIAVHVLDVALLSHDALALRPSQLAAGAVWIACGRAYADAMRDATGADVTEGKRCGEPCVLHTAACAKTATTLSSGSRRRLVEWGCHCGGESDSPEWDEFADEPACTELATCMFDAESVAKISGHGHGMVRQVAAFLESIVRDALRAGGLAVNADSLATAALKSRLPADARDCGRVGGSPRETVRRSPFSGTSSSLQSEDDSEDDSQDDSAATGDSGDTADDGSGADRKRSTRRGCR
ncbi:unnamed protein product [Pedinophyceae sp. YPF-701]|nr:unnamed protein product [Pedinophyceae sp. YPF-701]